VSAPLIEGLWVAAEYSTGEAMASETGGLTDFHDAMAGLRAENSESGTVALKGKIRGFRDAGACVVPVAAFEAGDCGRSV